MDYSAPEITEKIKGDILDELNSAHTKFDDLDVNIGDTIVVHYKINEGGNEVSMKYKGLRGFSYSLEATTDLILHAFNL